MLVIAVNEFVQVPPASTAKGSDLKDKAVKALAKVVEVYPGNEASIGDPVEVFVRSPSTHPLLDVVPEQLPVPLP